MLRDDDDDGAGNKQRRYLQQGKEYQGTDRKAKRIVRQVEAQRLAYALQENLHGGACQYALEIDLSFKTEYKDENADEGNQQAEFACIDHVQTIGSGEHKYSPR